MEDLKHHSQKWKEEGNQVIVMGDINEYINCSSIMAFFKHLDMRELISERHRKKGPASTRSNKSGVAIDRIWATLGVSIIAGGYLPFNHLIRSDHQLISIKFRLAYAFGNIEPPMRKPAARDLRMDNEIGQRRCNKEVKNFYIRHYIEERM
eukprot:298933-Ditylum_brightwellii.AAC.1